MGTVFWRSFWKQFLVVEAIRHVVRRLDYFTCPERVEFSSWRNWRKSRIMKPISLKYCLFYQKKKKNMSRESNVLKMARKWLFLCISARWVSWKAKKQGFLRNFSVLQSSSFNTNSCWKQIVLDGYRAVLRMRTCLLKLNTYLSQHFPFVLSLKKL